MPNILFPQVLKELVIESLGNDISQSNGFGRIVNERHWQRIMRLLDTTTGKVVPLCPTGPSSDKSSKYIAPVLILSPSLDDTLMKEEIFGPILPILTYDCDTNPITEAQVACKVVNRVFDSPLHSYIFGFDNNVIASITDYHQSGGLSVNETLISYGHTELPFGGVRRSGYGVQRGKFGFEDLSYKRSIYRRFVHPFNLEIVPHMYPPYDRWNSTIGLLSSFLKHFRKVRKNCWKWLPVFVAAILAYIGFKGSPKK